MSPAARQFAVVFAYTFAKPVGFHGFIEMFFLNMKR